MKILFLAVDIDLREQRGDSVHVRELVSNLVAIGQTVEVTPAGSSQALQGKVTAISPAATISSGVATFGVGPHI